MKDRPNSPHDNIPSPRALDSPKDWPEGPKKKQIGTVDMTPKWVELLPDLLTVLNDPQRPQASQHARESLYAMARAADAYVAQQRLLTDALRLNEDAMRVVQARLIDGGHRVKK